MKIIKRTNSESPIHSVFSVSAVLCLSLITLIATQSAQAATAINESELSCTNLGGVLGPNLIPNGSFPSAGDLSTNIYGATTAYDYLFDPSYSDGWPNDGSWEPDNGKYLITSRTGPVSYGASAGGIWHDLTGVGANLNPRDRFMVINGHLQAGVVFEMPVSVSADKSYEFSAYFSNLVSSTVRDFIEPNLAFEYSDDNGVTWSDVVSTGNIPYTTTPTWEQRVGYVTAGATGTMLIRFRSVTPGGSGNDFAIDGLSFQECEIPFDYSDAPAGGSTAPDGSGITTYGEAMHTIVSGLQLGAAIDEDLVSIASANADGDGADDDGVTFPELEVEKDASISVAVNQLAANDGYLQAWIDWNGDGDFAANEQIASNLQSSIAGASTIDIAVTVPADATINPTFARFRWSSSPDLDTNGTAMGGEVEDYMLVIKGDESTAACVIDDIATRQYSSASPSASSRFLSDSTYVYEAIFDSNDWSGQILAYNLTTEQGKGGVKAVVWDSNRTVRAGSRSLFTYNPTAESVRGSQLDWDSLNDQQKSWFARNDGAAMGQARVNWLQGVPDTTAPGNSLRARSVLMGDIINSSLTLRDPITNYGYKLLPGVEGTSYASFLADKIKSSASLLFGTNDGMFHALDPKTGEELFAYVPNEVIKRLPDVSSPLYGCDEADCLKHEYMVDGVSTLGDAYLSGSWRTVLLGTLGLGGQGLFALDVSEPENFSETDILWEMSSSQAPDNAATFSQHLGYTQPSASIVRIKNGKWVAVVANGYDSKSKQAVLFVIDMETGALIKSFNTLSGSEASPNGLSTPTVVDMDGDFIADRVYAGDMLGNLWSIDISSEDTTEWKFAYGNNAAPEPFFRTCSDNSCTDPQAITAAPQVGKNQVSGLMVYIGTGRYFDIADGSLEFPGFDSFYGVQDNGVTVKRSELVKQEILADVAVTSDLKSRITSDNSVDYTNDRGWYLDLLTPPAARANGERVISKAILRGGRIIFTTLTPTVGRCDLGGTSWIMEIDAQDGSRLSVVTFDVNDDMAFTEADNSTYQDDPTVVSGLQQVSLGLVRSAPVIMHHTTRSEGKYVSGSETGVGMFRESTSKFSGRMSWTSISN